MASDCKAEGDVLEGVAESRSDVQPFTLMELQTLLANDVLELPALTAVCNNLLQGAVCNNFPLMWQLLRTQPHTPHRPATRRTPLTVHRRSRGQSRGSRVRS